MKKREIKMLKKNEKSSSNHEDKNMGITNSENLETNLHEKLISLNRCTKVVKGGRRFSFSALMVVGDKNGKIGVGFGKAKEIPDAIKKAIVLAKKNMIVFQLKRNTISHEIIGRFKSSSIWMKPACPGTGLIAGETIRSVLELAGVHDILTKSLKNNNPINLVKSLLQGLKSLKNFNFECKKRNKNLYELFEVKRFQNKMENTSMVSTQNLANPKETS